MAKYHAATKTNQPMCGANGTANGYHVITLTASRWNALPADQRCKRCIDAIRKAKALRAEAAQSC